MLLFISSEIIQAAISQGFNIVQAERIEYCHWVDANGHQVGNIFGNNENMEENAASEIEQYITSNVNY